MKPLHLACAADARYLPHCAAMLHSALARHAPGELSIHFLHGPGLVPRARQRLARLAATADAELTFHDIPDSAIAGLPTIDRIPGVMWYRIFLPDLLPELDKILYLDADILVVDSLKPLWDIDLGDRYVAAVTNVFDPAHRQWPRSLGLKAPRDYFNSGVLLMNLSTMRQDRCTGALRAFGLNASSRLQFPDQDALNMVLGSRRRHLHPRWNCMNSLPFYPDSATFFDDNEVADALRSPAVLHFEGTGFGKPWHFLNRGPHREIYYRHLRASGWRAPVVEGLTPGNIARRYLPSSAKRLIKRALSPLGYGISDLNGAPTVYRKRGDGLVPCRLADHLHEKNPRLEQLRQRYARIESPLASRSLWATGYLRGELQLPFFRGDNAYLWQDRDVGGGNVAAKYALYAGYVAARDPRNLLSTLGEDGAFGCLTFSSPFGLVSRDLLDSVSELYFIDRVIGLFERKDLRVLDIGAGYGRLAHRMSAAVLGLTRYTCVDAIPESTFLSETYLRYRACTPPAAVVPLDDLDNQVRGSRVDLAVNIHSFSEMPCSAIRAWLELLVELEVANLLIVPNDEDKLLSWEADRSRVDVLPLLASLGFRLRATEPTIADPALRERIGTKHHFLMFERAAS